MHVSVDPDFVVSEEEGSQSVVSVEHDLPILAEEVGSQINSGSRTLSGNSPKALALVNLTMARLGFTLQLRILLVIWRVHRVILITGS